MRRRAEGDSHESLSGEHDAARKLSGQCCLHRPAPDHPASWQETGCQEGEVAVSSVSAVVGGAQASVAITRRESDDEKVSRVTERKL
jgi:hypothetical protein